MHLIFGGNRMYMALSNRHKIKRKLRTIGPAALGLMILCGVGCDYPLNHPYPETRGKNWHLVAMASEPSTMNTVRMADGESVAVASNLVVTPFRYAYLTRPITLEPYLAKRIPKIHADTLNGKQVYSMELELEKRYYAPVFQCLQDNKADAKGRPILAQDLELMLKRNADPANEAFMISLLTDSIVGFAEYNAYISQERKEAGIAAKSAVEQADILRKIYSRPMEGVRVLSDDRLRIYLKRPIDRILYFFAFVSSAPIPEQCWYHLNGLEKDQHALDQKIVSSGPYFLESWMPRDRIVLQRNALYSETFPELPPDSALPDSLRNNVERKNAFVALEGRQLPFIDRIVFYLIQSGSTVWTLFDQGYQDRVALSRDSYDGVLEGGELKQDYQERGVTLSIETELATFGWIFNLEDPVIGPNLALRKAIRCSIDVPELIERFFHGRALEAHGLIPPGIEGYQPAPRSGQKCGPEEGKAWLRKAGYANGIDPSTGKPLVLRLIDVPRPGASSFHNFLVESLQSIGIRLQVDLYDGPTYYEKRMKRKFQMSTWGWGADYPDPQNFFQLFYGPNSQNTYNESHFRNAAFDAAYRALETEDPRLRSQTIEQMNGIIDSELPVLLLFHRLTFGVSQPWMGPIEPHPMGLNLMQYRTLDVRMRDEMQDQINSF